MSNLTATVYYGPVINPLTKTSFDALPRCLLAVNKSGIIDWIVKDVEDSMVQEVMLQHGYVDVDVCVLASGEFLMPGLIDTHTHAPQVPNIGSGQQYELLDWLEHVTFPMEARFADAALAEETYKSVVKRIINSGTTTCCYYGSLHLEATQKLAEVVHAFGQRAFVGKCNMDRNSPAHYVEMNAEQSAKDTQMLISHIRSLGNPLVQPILTPRFAITCTDELLSSLGALAAEDPALRIQTHISENASEIAFTKELFPMAKSYSHVYDMHGLLRENTILAHAIHLEDDDISNIIRCNAGISHCPTSNFNLRSGVAPIGFYLDLGIKVGLGTDVSGGYSTSILQNMQTASMAAKIIAIQNAGIEAGVAGFQNKQLSIATLLYLGTLGGAEVCCLETVTGSFAEGKAFDALLVDVRDGTENPQLWTRSTPNSQQDLEGILERFIFCGDDRNISKVFVQGRCIGGRSS